MTGAYTYDSAHPHAVSTVTYTDLHGSTPVANHYTYDANGNMTQRVVNGVTWTMTYNQENRVQAMANGDLSIAATFTYDADGNKVAQNLNGTITYYFPSTALPCPYRTCGGMLRDRLPLRSHFPTGCCAIDLAQGKPFPTGLPFTAPAAPCLHRTV